MKYWFLCMYPFYTLLVVGWQRFLERPYIYSYSRLRENTRQTKVWIPAKFNLVNQWVLLQQEMTQTVISPKPTPHGWQLIKAGSQEHTAQPARSSIDWGVYVLTDSVGLNLFKAGVVWVFLAAWLVWAWFSAAFSSGREGPSESHQFWGLPETILSCLPSCLRSFPAE